MIRGNVAVKREFQRFVNRFFYNKEKSEENLSTMYYYLDDIISYVEKLQAEVGTELIESDFTECFLEEEGKKVFFDESLNVILIDAISFGEKKTLERERNREIELQQQRMARRENLNDC